MTSPAYGQEATEASHTALMRSRLLQQMQQESCETLPFRSSAYLDTAEDLDHDRGCCQQGFGEGCLLQPLRGSGHHHYLPSPGLQFKRIS